MSFRSRTVSAIGWSAVSRLGSQLVSLAVVVVLARLLGPTAFGLIAMITVFSSFADLFADLGFGAALVQKPDVEEVHRSSVFWSNLVVGFALGLLFLAAAPLVADFYDEPRLTALTAVIALNFPIVSMVVVQRMLLRKQLDFRSLAQAEVSGVVLGGAAGIAAALAGAGVWALVLKTLVASITTVVLLWLRSDWRPRVLFRRAALAELAGFSGSYLGTATLGYWARNVDNLLIGRVLGSVALGLYSQAYRIFLLPLNTVSNVIGNVLFPSLSMIQHDPARVARIYLRVTRSIALITFPLMVGLFVTADSFVLAVFGPAWAGMIPLLRIFALVGITGSIRTITGNLYLSQGRADLQLRVALVLRTLKIALLATGVLVGRDIVWVAVALAIGSWVNHFPTFWFAGRLVGLRFRDEVRAVAPVFLVAVAMGAGVFGVDLLLPDALPVEARFAMLAVAGLLLYGAILHLARIEAYTDAVALLRDQLRGGRGAALAGEGRP